MGSLLYVRRGGSAGAASTQLVDVAPYFDQPGTPRIQLGMRYGGGEATQGSFVVLDSSGRMPAADLSFTLGARMQVKWTENAAGCEYWLAVGRILTTDEGRGVRRDYRAAEWSANVEDANVDLRGQAFTEAWVRPQETDYARIVALQAYVLNGFASTAPYFRGTTEIVATDSHFCKNANTVTMPATTYPIGTQPQDVIDDCATTAGKDYGVVIHHGSGFSSAGGTPAIEQETGNFADGTPGGTRDGVVVSGAVSNRALVAFFANNYSTGSTPTSVKYRPNASGGSGAFDATFTQIGSPITLASTADDDPASKGIRITAWYLVAPSASSGATNGSVFASGQGAGPQAIEVYNLSGVDQSSPIAFNNDGTANGATSISTSSGADSAMLVLDGIAYRTLWSSAAVATPGAGQTQDAAGTNYETFGIQNTVLQCSHKVGASAMAWSSIPTTAESAPHWPFCGTVQKVVSVQGAVTGGAGCSHLCLQYIVPSDLTTNPCTLKISDARADVDEDTATPPTVYGPRWIQGKATNRDGQRVLSGIVSTYQTPSGTGSVFARSTTRESRNDYWVDPVSDSFSQTPAQAQVRASAVLQTFLDEHITHRVSLPIAADQTYKIAAGMAIQVKAAAMLGGNALGIYSTRRIAQLVWEPRNDGYYWAHMELDRPERLTQGNPQIGAAAGDATRAAIATGTYAGQTVQQAINSLAAANPLTTLGDLLYRGAGGSNTRLGIGASNFHLTSDGSAPLWSPQTSGLSDPMTTIGDIIVRNASNVTARLGIGASNTVLTALGSGAAPVWGTAPSGGSTSPLTTKGDTHGYSTTDARIPIGTDAQVLTADSTQTLGLKWATLPAGAGSRVYNSAAFSVGASTETAVTFDSERSDSDAFHSTSSNTSRLTVPTGKAGRYAIAGTVEWAASALGTLRRLSIRLNGSTYIAKDEITSIINAALPQSVETVYDLIAGDYVELVAFQDTVGAVNLQASGNYSPEFGMMLAGATSGAPTDASYIVSTPNSTLTAEITRPELADPLSGNTAIDMSGAATGTGVTANAETDCAGAIAYTNASYQYWDVASAVGTGDFDYRARILSAFASSPAGTSPPLFYFGVTDSARTSTTGLYLNFDGIGPSTTALNQLRGGHGLFTGDTAILYIPYYPFIARVARVGTTVSFYASFDNGRRWSTLGTATSSLNVAKVGVWGNIDGNTAIMTVVHWIRSNP